MANYATNSANASERANSTVYSSGNRVVIARSDTQTNYLLMRKYVYECTTAGTSGGTVPAYNTTPGGTTTDGTVTWTTRECDSWTNAGRYADYLINNRLSTDDILYMAEGDIQTCSMNTSQTLDLTFPTGAVLVAAKTAAWPPTQEATTHAEIKTTGTSNNAIRISGTDFRIRGVDINSDDGSSTAGFFINNSAAGYCHLEKMKLQCTGTGSNILHFGLSTSQTYGGHLEDCEIVYNRSGHVVSFRNGNWEIDRCKFSQTIQPTVPFRSPDADATVIVTFNGCDFTDLSSTIFQFDASTSANLYRVKNCKKASGTTWSNTPSNRGARVEIYNSGSGTADYMRIHDFYGLAETDTANYVSGGPSYSIKFTTTSAANKYAPFVARIMVLNADLSSSPKTIRIPIISDGVTFKDDEVWMVLYYPDDTTGLHNTVSDGLADLLSTASNQTTASDTWTHNLTTPTKQELSVTTSTAGRAGYSEIYIYVAKPSATVYVGLKDTVS